MLNVRETSQYTRNKEAFQEIEQLLEGKADVSYFVFKFSKKKKSVAVNSDQTGAPVQSSAAVQPEEYEPPPLSWHLTKKEQDAIKQVSCEMRSGLDLNENTTNWKGLMDLLKNPVSANDWARCSSPDQ
jgi:hypothetical protein